MTGIAIWPIGMKGGFALINHSIGFGASVPETNAVSTVGANFIVLAASYLQGVSFTIQDSLSNSWSVADTVTNPSGPITTIWYCFNPTIGPSHTFELNGTDIYGTITMEAFSGAVSGTLDQHTDNIIASGNTIQPGSITPLHNGELIVAAYCGPPGGGSAPPTLTVDSSFIITDGVAYSEGNYFGGAMAYLVQNTAILVNPTWTDTAAPNTASIASFE